MSRLVCPACQAEFDSDLLEGDRSAPCPFCGGDLGSVLTESADFTAEPDTVTAAPQGDIPVWWKPVPARSRMQVVDCTPERLLLIVPGGKSAGGFGCFALLWNAFMVLFTGIMVFAGLDEKMPKGAGLLVPVVFVGVFWLVGLGLVFAWLKLRFERTLMLLEPGRIVTQKVLLGRRQLKEVELGSQHRAELVEAYRQNNVPVYSVKVEGSSSAVTFGAALANDEKDWLVETINRFLGGESPVSLPDASGDVLSVVAVTPLTAATLPMDSLIVIERSEHDRLTLHYPLIPYPKIRLLVGCVCLAVSGIWLTVNATTQFKVPDVITFVLVIPVLLGAVIPLALAVNVLFGRTRVDLTPETLSCCWGMRPFRRTWSLPTAFLESIELSDFTTISEGRGPRKKTVVGYACFARGNGKTIMLTLPEKPETHAGSSPGLSAQVAGLLQNKLAEMGIKLGGAV